MGERVEYYKSYGRTYQVSTTIDRKEGRYQDAWQHVLGHISHVGLDYNYIRGLTLITEKEAKSRVMPFF